MRYSIRFRFDGDLADQHVIDASDGLTFHEGARQLLALHAFYFTSGDVPNGGVINHTKAYRILECASQQGSIEFVYLVELFVKGAVTAAAAKSGDLLFEQFLVDSMKKALSKRLSERRGTWSREEKALKSSGGDRAPSFETEAEARRRWERFQLRVMKTLTDCFRPIGRSATILRVRVGESAPMEVTLNDLRDLQIKISYIQDANITVAVRAVRERDQIAEYVFAGR